ncbi:MAG: hypothetical protein AABO57_10965 [Acidobacteriota bacterium]
MAALVVDTNVAVVANSGSRQASDTCFLVCVERLGRITSDEDKLVLDDMWRIIKEYQNNLQPSGKQPGIGEAFLKWVLTNRENPQRCDLIRINQMGNDDTEFVEFPDSPELDGFDRSDRKFVAVALSHPDNPTILQAVDSKWWPFRHSLQASGVSVEFICEDDIERLYRSRAE